MKKYLGPGKDNAVRPRHIASAEHGMSHGSAKANTACKAVKSGSLSERRRLPFSSPPSGLNDPAVGFYP